MRLENKAPMTDKRHIGAPQKASPVGSLELHILHQATGISNPSMSFERLG